MSAALEIVKSWEVGQLAAVVYKLGDENARRILTCRKVTVTFDDASQTAAVVGVPPILDCSKPFVLSDYLGAGWKSLDEEQDIRALSLTSVDFSKALYVTCLNEGEPFIKGEEKLRRLKEEHPQLICHGGNQFRALWEDYQQNKENSVLEWLRINRNITDLDFFGLILQHQSGYRSVLYLYWNGEQWNWVCFWLDHEWGDRRLSGVSPAS